MADGERFSRWMSARSARRLLVGCVLVLITWVMFLVAGFTWALTGSPGIAVLALLLNATAGPVLAVLLLAWKWLDEWETESRP